MSHILQILKQIKNSIKSSFYQTFCTSKDYILLCQIVDQQLAPAKHQQGCLHAGFNHRKLIKNTSDFCL